MAYDSQKDVYYRFFEELADAIDVLTGYNSRTSEPYMERYALSSTDVISPIL